MDTKTARRKSFDVEYVVVTDDNIEEVAEWCKSTVETEPGDNSARFIKIVDLNVRNARQAKAFVGDHVLSYGAKSFKAYTEKAFYRSFDDVVVSGEKTVEHARSAQTGEFVSKEYAKAHPDVTVVEAFKAANHTIEGGMTPEELREQIGLVVEQDGVDPKTLGETPTEDLRGL